MPEAPEGYGSMLMVIFGAGASFDSVAEPYWSSEMSKQNRPPLAAELLDARLRFIEHLSNFPQCGELVAYLRGCLIRKEDLEEALQRRYARAKGAHERKALLAFRFYLQGVISQCSEWSQLAGGATNYAALISRIESDRENQPVALVTFNYDLLLEEAMS